MRGTSVAGKSVIVPAVAVMALLGASRPALAQGEEAVVAPELAAGTAGGALDRPFYVGLGIGGVFGLKGGAGDGMFRIEEDVGYHVWSIGSHPGLFVGLLANQAFAKGGQIFDIDARLGFDINVYEWGSGALLVTPGTAIGVCLFRTSFDVVDPWTGETTTNSDTSALFDIMFNAELRAVFVDGLISVWFRPVGIEVTAAKGGAGANWDLNAGVLFNF
jgi:hypothetical protein